MTQCGLSVSTFTVSTIPLCLLLRLTYHGIRVSQVNSVRERYFENTKWVHREMEEKVDQVGNECVEGDGKDEVGVGSVMDCMVSGAFLRCCPFFLLKLPQGTKTW